MTHGLCGKEGAMVFKRVLKGIGRLMLTTVVMCGVGLFLCSSDVKAAGTLPENAAGDQRLYVTDADDNNYQIVIDAPANATYKGIKEFKVKHNSNTVYEVTSFSSFSEVTNDASNAFIPLAEIPKNDLDIAIMNSIPSKIPESALSSGNTIMLDVSMNTSQNGNDYEERAGEFKSKPIYKVSAAKTDAFSGVNFTPSFKYVVGGRNSQYGYSNEEYKITNEPYTADNYYMLAKDFITDPSSTFDASDTGWKNCSAPDVTIATGSINGANVEYKVAYLPKVTSISVSGSSNTTKTKLIDTTSPKSLSAISDSIEEIETTVTFDIDSLISSAESSANLSTVQGYYKVECVPSLPSETTEMQLNVPLDKVTAKTFDVKMRLNNTNSVGTGKVTTKLVLGDLTVASVDLPITLGCKPTGILFQNVPISVMVGGGSQVVQVLKGIEPSGAIQDFSSYSGTITETTGNLLDHTPEYFKYDPATGTVTVKASSTATPGATAKVRLTLTDSSFSNSVSKEFEVKIISFDKGKTIDSINKSNKNYITYNKDKGYSLDINQLIIDNAKDSSGNAITISKDQITEIKVGGSPCDGSWKPSEAALNQKVSCKINGVQISESDGFKVSAYPMPTATYSSSNRTLSVKIPTKVATAYSDDNNIRQSKGFKLILEDSSGNTLYEYTDSKYQSVLSSSSESTVTYTVPAADIEGMVTSAASNGKFSADTTSVKFKVIPMGYKQSSTSDETIKAKDEIAGKTDAVTVYKVSASGTNFTSSAAYGLDGQTVSITATPNSGYSFKQWSDGNTSNPRQVKVSASGTRSFQAVAGDRVANSTGAGGTDNSELYDDVPKTAESNSAIWLIVFMVFAVMGTTYALYLQLKAANSKHDR